MTASDDKRPRGRPPKEETVVARKAVEQHRATKAAESESKPALAGMTTKQIRNRYDGAGTGRRMAGWNPPSTGPNTALNNPGKLLERARDARRNDPSGASATEKWTTALVGIGVTPRFKRITNTGRRREINDDFAKFVKVADADCVLNLYGLQTLGVMTWFDGGECFARRRNRDIDDSLPVPFQVQLLESDMVPRFDSEAREGLPRGNVIRSGIELNRRGRRVAYWVYKQHPADGNYSFTGAEELVRVAASEMIHMFQPTRPGQLRGVPLLAPVLPQLRDTSDYKDAVLTRQKLANLFMAFIKRTLPQGLQGDTDPLDGTPIDNDLPAAPMAPMQPGLMQELDEGQDIAFANPPEAGTTYSDYVRTTGLDTAAGVGLPYELMFGDILNVSDRTLRIVINEFRRLAEQRQWQILIPQFCQRIVEWYAEGAVLMGTISLEEADLVTKCEHSPHGWPDIHPTQDIEGRAKAVEAGFRSRSSVIAAGGDDPDAVDEERAGDKKREDKLGLTPVEPAEPPPPGPSNVEEALAWLHDAEADRARAAAEQMRAPPAPTPPPSAPGPLSEATLDLTRALAARAIEPALPPTINVQPNIVIEPPAAPPVAVLAPAPAPTAAVLRAMRKVPVRDAATGLIAMVKEYDGDRLVKVITPVRDAQGFVTEFQEELITS